MDTDVELGHIWQELPDNLLLQIFSFLKAADLVRAAETCHRWFRVVFDESIWKDLVCREFSIQRQCRVAPGKFSWQDEYKRLYYNSPVVESEVLTNHLDEVLHVSFSHNGEMFATTSKDATIKVWQVGEPTTLKYTADMKKEMSWDFTQFSCFNKVDSLLLVSGVVYTNFDRRGFLAVFSITNNFNIIKVTTMDPSQLFGTWLSQGTFLGGSLEINLDRFTTSVEIDMFDISDTECETEAGASSEKRGQSLFTFCSENASLIKFLTVAEVPRNGPLPSELEPMDTDDYSEEKASSFFRSGSIHNSSQTVQSEQKTEDFDTIRNHEYGCFGDDSLATIRALSESNTDCTVCQSSSCTCKTLSVGTVVLPVSSKETKVSHASEHPNHVKMYPPEQENKHSGNLPMLNASCPMSVSDSELCTSSALKESENKLTTKYLIFVTGEFAVALHQIGIKVMTVNEAGHCTNRAGHGAGHSCQSGGPGNGHGHIVVNVRNNDIEMRNRQPDKTDFLLDLHGHVTGMCLSSDSRYLFVNCRPWVGKDVDRTDPWATPDLSSHIQIRVIDLYTLQDLGVYYSGHLGWSPAFRCCFVFLDVSEDYVASGSEDTRGYLWDRHYRVNLMRFPHGPGVVNSVGFNPKDQEYLVTVSDDHTIKIWRSRNGQRSFLAKVPAAATHTGASCASSS